MKMSGNTILITGGGSGIGLALAQEFKRLGNEVIVAGRSKEKLKAAEAQGLKTLTVDMTNHVSIQSFAMEAIQKFPALNVVIHCAGIMVNENLTTSDNSETALQTVQTNLLGPIFLTNALLPHLMKQKASTIFTVSSGLAFTPLMMTPTYSATKAAIHSYTESLRFQLKETSVEVKEIAPPYVQTHLMGERQANDPHAMPLKSFISEVFEILNRDAAVEEVLVQKVLPLRNSSYTGAENYKSFFTRFNEGFLAARKEEWDKM